MATLSIRVPNEILERLDQLAAKTGRTKAFYIKDAILNHIDDIERRYLAEQEPEIIDPELEATLLAALDEGPATPFTKQDWIDIRERGMARYEARRQKERNAKR